MMPLGAYLREQQPEEYRNWVTVLMRHGYAVPRWSEWGGVSVVKPRKVEQEQDSFTGFQRFVDKLMRRKPQRRG